MAVVKRNGTIVLVLLVALSLLGGRFGHGEAHDCVDIAAAASHGQHVQFQPAPEFHAIGPAAHAAAGICNALSCPMTGCCFPQMASAGIEAPRSASTAMPLLLAVDASGTDPAKIEHPPRHP